MMRVSLAAFRLSGLIPLLFILLMAPVLPDAVNAQGWRILEYDENGVAIGTRNSREVDSDGFIPRTDRPIEEREVILVDPTDEQIFQLENDGYRVLENNRMEELGFTLVVLRTPNAVDVAEALRDIRARFPNLMISANDLMDLSRGNPPYRQVAQVQGDFTRELSGWGDVSESCGAGITLGQIDGFVDTDHPALRGRRIIFQSFLREGRVPAAEDHGTAVAILLIGRSVSNLPAGLLPGARLYAANIFEQRDGRERGNLAAMVRAVDWLVGNDVKVANLSIAGSENAVMRLAINRAREQGLLLVSAAGNNGPAAPPAWPAAHPESLAVTAVDRSLELYRHANRGDYIDFAAPGVDVPTQTPHGQMVQSGTSFAAPFVTAMVAIHLQMGFDPDPDLIRRSLQRYATDLGTTGRDDTFGWGLVRLRPNC